jgi:hypothetical protein
VYYFSFLTLFSVSLFLLSGVVVKKKQESKANQPTKKAQNAKGRECEESLKKKRKYKTIRKTPPRPVFVASTPSPFHYHFHPN